MNQTQHNTLILNHKPVMQKKITEINIRQLFLECIYSILIWVQWTHKENVSQCTLFNANHCQYFFD